VDCAWIADDVPFFGVVRIPAMVVALDEEFRRRARREIELGVEDVLVPLVEHIRRSARLSRTCPRGAQVVQSSRVRELIPGTEAKLLREVVCVLSAERMDVVAPIAVAGAGLILRVWKQLIADRIVG